MEPDDRLLPISGLQHMVFCDRQAALIHVDRVWVDNHLTVEGSHLHRTVDDGRSTLRGGVRTLRGLDLTSRSLGLVGKADVVELHPAGDGERGVKLQELGTLRWNLVPVEYKRGRPKSHRADEVQLCAQALCLEEMFSTRVEGGALFYGEERRRTELTFDDELRGLVSEVAQAFHAIVDAGLVPVRKRERKCDRCSLLDVCLPPRRNQPASASGYLDSWMMRPTDTRRPT